MQEKKKYRTILSFTGRIIIDTCGGFRNPIEVFAMWLQFGNKMFNF